MRSVVYQKLGDSSVLELVERDLPEPHWGEVRVRLAVAGVNPTDWKFRAGATASSLPFPEISPGQDGAGVVDAVAEVCATEPSTMLGGKLSACPTPRRTTWGRASVSRR